MTECIDCLRNACSYLAASLSCEDKVGPERWPTPEEDRQVVAFCVNTEVQVFKILPGVLFLMII